MMRFKIKPWDPSASYEPGDTVFNGRWQTRSRSGTWLPIGHVPPDPSLIGPPGRDGSDGIGVDGRDGLPGRDGNPGQALRWCGEWRRKTSYAPLDCVVCDGSSYICTDATSSRPPNRRWDLMARAGSDGVDGASTSTSVVRFRNQIVSGPKLTMILAQDSGIGSVCFTMPDGRAGLASTNDPFAIGFLDADGVEGHPGHITTGGLFINPAWSLSIGADYFLSAVPGEITSTPPTSGYLVAVGSAIDAHSLNVEIAPPIKLA